MVAMRKEDRVVCVGFGLDWPDDLQGTPPSVKFSTSPLTFAHQKKTTWALLVRNNQNAESEQPAPASLQLFCLRPSHLVGHTTLQFCCLSPSHLISHTPQHSSAAYVRAISLISHCNAALLLTS
eukprot:1148048-Pelagomonas_calceolata.AAC.2